MYLRLSAALFVAACLSQSSAVPSAGATASSAGCTLRVHVDNFHNARGNLGTVVFNSPAGWPENIAKTFRHGPAPIDAASKTAVAEWANIPPGNYAVAAIHDENSNAKLDRNMIGVPKEGFGFANNPHVGLSAPAFNAALVHVNCPVTDITIHLQYK